MNKSIGTVCFIVVNNQVLLAEIEMPDGTHVWNGLGGVVDDGETLEQAVSREMAEETKLIIRPQHVKEVKVIHLGNLELHAMVTNKWAGKLVPNEPSILQLQWFDIKDVPYHQMHPGNEKWVPEVLRAGQALSSNFVN